jgi:pimeloyl-ACP methyl ester carboxylesterase
MTTHEYPAQSHLIDLPAGRFHYLSWNAEQTEKGSVVLLHGITSSAQSWIRVGPALGGRYRVYALDQRGHGDSVKPESGKYSLKHTADDAAAFIEALGLEKPIVIGHSWGGAIALVLASGGASDETKPALTKLILEDPAHNIGAGEGDPEDRSIAFTRDIGRPANELRTEITLTSPGWTQADIEGKIDALHKVSREAVINVFAEAGQQGELLPLLGKIAVPTLLLRADPALGSTLDETAWERAKWYLSEQSQAVQVDGASHNIHRSKFEEFMRIVDDFLS